MTDEDVCRFADEIISGKMLSEDEIRSILKTEDPESLRKLYLAARTVRDHFFSNKVFLYSFVYFSTYCRNKCAFCYYRTDNKISRYRLTPDDLRDMCRRIRNEGVHMIDLTMGEDPHFRNHPENLVEFVRIAKEESGLPVMVSPGVIDDGFIRLLKEAGADFFALYQETHDRDLFKALRTGQDFDERAHARTAAKFAGLCIEDGILSGTGRTPEEEIDADTASILAMIPQNPDQVRAMTFEPQPGTPLEKQVQAPYLYELKIISALRLVFPDRLIPASLDVAGIPGMVERLNAGANVVTSIIAADSSLEGVVNFDKDVGLYERQRDAASVIAKLHEMNMVPGTQAEFEDYLRKSSERKCAARPEKSGNGKNGCEMTEKECSA